MGIEGEGGREKPRLWLPAEGWLLLTKAFPDQWGLLLISCGDDELDELSTGVVDVCRYGWRPSRLHKHPRHCACRWN